MRSAELVIVGGGPAGLSLAYHYGRNSLILEKEQKVGELCQAFGIDRIFLIPPICRLTQATERHRIADQINAAKIRRSRL
jgi:flavin-dependent dehydrogenase